MSITSPQPIVQSGRPVADRYEQLAYAKLWALLPEVYRAQDSVELDGPGPLQELCRRLAVQVAVLRRSLDRLWEDQSIEGCEDWVIPYIAELLDTNLVPAMDARGQRLDVANTINYRRRKGTLGLIEQLAADVTGWECRAVEFFRRLTRRRHGLDPAIGRPADSADPAGARLLQEAELLVGALSGTPAGGYADLRSAVGAAATGSAFDEFSHRADVRRGRGALGWYTISKLGLFLWRSPSIAVARATPVGVTGCPGHYAFDPTGRQTALWQADDRPVGGYGEGWTALAEWQVPGPISQLVYEAIRALAELPLPHEAWPDRDASLWPGSLSISALGSGYPIDERGASVWTDVGRFKVAAGGPTEVEVSYHYGLPSLIGAGPYDRRQVCVEPTADPLPVASVEGGSAALTDALAAIDGAATIVITDGLTSTSVADVGSAAWPLADLCVRAVDEGRAVIRLPASAEPWVLDGGPVSGAGGAHLRLEGLLFSGQDIVLRGRFERVTISCCTLDPGTAGDLRQPPLTWEPAVDGQSLSATRLWIEGSVKSLVVERSVLGPIRTRQGGVTEEITISDSVVQGLVDPAIETETGVTTLCRTTVLGRGSVHRLYCSESILDDVFIAGDVQDGCVRFSAWSTGSTVPRKYESVRVAPGSPLFESRRFGESFYAQLAGTADAEIVAGATAGTPSIRSGSHDGSEMGAFCSGGAAVKERSLLIKLDEYMPVGLTPVLIPMPPFDAEAENKRGRPWPST